LKKTQKKEMSKKQGVRRGIMRPLIVLIYGFWRKGGVFMNMIGAMGG
jgi:hypothetical protein